MVLTVNVLLILDLWEVIFFSQAKHVMGHSESFQWGRDFFLPLNCPECSKEQFWGQKSLGPLEKSQEITPYMLCPRRKNNITNFKNQRCIGIFMLYIFWPILRDFLRGPNSFDPYIVLSTAVMFLNCPRLSVSSAGLLKILNYI
jgi:hypothetical protein